MTKKLIIQSSRLLFVFMVIGSCCQELIGQDLQAILTNGQPKNEQAEMIWQQGRKYFQTMKWNDAEVWLDQGIRLMEGSKNDTMAGKLYLDRGNLAIMQGKPKTALQFLHSGESHLDHTSAWHHLGSCFLLLAKSHSRLENKDSALIYYRKAEETYQKLDNYHNWATYVEMGNFFETAGNHSEAEKYYEKSYELTKSGRSKSHLGLTVYILGGFYSRRNMAKEFSLLYQSYQSSGSSGKYPNQNDPVHTPIRIDWGNKTLQEKVSFLESAKSNLLSQNFVTNACNLNEEIAILYEGEQQYKAALNYIYENIEMSKRDSSYANQFAYSKVAYRLLKKAGMTEEALVMAEKMIGLKDTLSNMKNIQIAMELDARYQNEKKQNEIALLTAKNNLSEKEISLLQSQNQLAETMILRQKEQQAALSRENALMDSIVIQQQQNNEILERENILKSKQLQKETELKAALNRENHLKNIQLEKERNTKMGFIAGAILLSLAIGVILIQFKRHIAKSKIISKQAEDLGVLIREIHHRVKNNLQLVSSMLELQSMSIKNKQAKEALDIARNRVMSIALVHQHLYGDNNIQKINTRDYLQALIGSIQNSLKAEHFQFSIKTQLDQMALDIDSVIPMGLVVNELVNNAYKYAFQNSHKGELSVELKEQDEHLLLRVRDNGIGFPPETMESGQHSFGLKMIKSFARRLNARFSMYNQNGAVAEFLMLKPIRA